MLRSHPSSTLFPYTTLFRSISESDAFRLMDVYVEKGGNFLDTAHMYAGWVTGGAGKSETTIGKWLKRVDRSEEHTSELQSRGHLVCRLLLEKKNKVYMLCYR